MRFNIKCHRFWLLFFWCGQNPSLSKIGYAILKTHTLPHPKCTEKDKTETKPDHVPQVDHVKMIIFSFIKYVASLKTKKRTHYRSTHGIYQHTGEEWTEPPTQQDSTEPREHVAELGTKIGAACFEPSTALHLQNPLNHDTYDPDQALFRPIGQMKFGDTVLAERLGSRGQGNVFYLASVTCVMFFEIPQDDNPALNKSRQEDTSSTGLGVCVLLCFY